MNAIKKNLLTFIFIVSAVLSLSRNANAGIVLTISGVLSPLGPVSLVIGGFGAFVGATMSSTDSNDAGGAIALAGALLFIVDADEALEQQLQFKDIPKYIFTEIEDIAEQKRDSAKKLDELHVEVVLTDLEVDELFKSADTSVNPDEYKLLRKMLTTSSQEKL